MYSKFISFLGSSCWSILPARSRPFVLGIPRYSQTRFARDKEMRNSRLLGRVWSRPSTIISGVISFDFSVSFTRRRRRVHMAHRRREFLSSQCTLRFPNIFDNYRSGRPSTYTSRMGSSTPIYFFTSAQSWWYFLKFSFFSQQLF